MLLFECGTSGSCFSLSWLNFQECSSQLVAVCFQQLRTYITNLANPVIIVAEDLGKASPRPGVSPFQPPNQSQWPGRYGSVILGQVTINLGNHGASLRKSQGFALRMGIGQP